MKRIISLILCVCLILGGAVPVSAAEEGRFALAVLTADGVVIEPTYIDYDEGVTVAEALLLSDYTFTGLAETGWIQEVEGVSASYSLFYDGGGWDLTVPVSEITALCLTTKVDHYSEGYLELIRTMAQFNAETNGVSEWEAARESYDLALAELYTADGVRAAELARALRETMDAYAAYIGGETVTVTFDAGGAVDAVLTGRFGNTYEGKQVTSLQVAPGEYDFDLSDGGINHIRGSVMVEGDTVLTAGLPEGQWLAEMDLSIANGDDWQAVEKLGDWSFVVPDYSGQHLYPYFVPGEGVDTSACAMYLGEGTRRTWRSHETSLPRVLESGTMTGTVLELEARKTWGDYEQYQTYPVEIIRSPSLSALEVTSEGTRLPLEFDSEVEAYSLTTTGDSVDILAIPRNGGTAITGDGHAELNDGITELEVTVSHENGQARSYSLTIEKLDSVAVTIDTDAEDLAVYNAAGAEIASVDGAYHLVPGESYRYETTTDEYYHTGAEFTASGGLHLNAPAPDTTDALSSLAVAAALKAAPYESDGEFAAGDHTYTYLVGSNETNFGIMAAWDTAYAVTALYTDHRGEEKEIAVTGTYKIPTNFLAVSGIGNTMTLRLSREEDGVSVYQDYILTAVRRMQLNDLSISVGDQTLTPVQPDGTGGYSKFITDYTLEVGQTVPALTLGVKLFSTAAGNDNAVTVTVESASEIRELDYRELAVQEVQTVEAVLDPAVSDETVAITVEREGAAAQTYTLNITKLPPVQITVTADPADALVYVTDDVTGERVIPEAGVCTLHTGRSYTYTVTRYGYVTKRSSFTAGAQDSLNVTLERAAQNSLADIALPTDWLSFRGNAHNNGVTSAPTPTVAEETVLNWANKIGEGTSNGGVGSPIIAGGDIFTYAGTTVYRIDKETGAVLASAEMDHASSFSITPPAYGEGMLFVALADGGVQAFSAETLESLWVYADALKGQPNCPVVYREGYVYTGFWNAEEKQANFVCISVTDEDPAQQKEEKLASWRYTHNGFYWAGACVTEEYLLVTTDDGSNGYTRTCGSILSIDPDTGILLDELVMPLAGDLRTSVCYDSETDAYYFASKGGEFYRVRVNADGTFEDGSLAYIELTNGTDSTANPPMSTSTPVVYKGRAYIGVSGIAQFSAYSGHNITVIDLKNWRIAYTVPTQGYPQTSGLLTTAWEEGTEYVYVYFLDNYTPGKLRVIRDTAGRNTFDTAYSTPETFMKNGKAETVQTGYVLFTPAQEQAQYTICSPIADEYGNLYFKNDSGYLMCLGSVITELVVERQPERMAYQVGEVFDPAGMAVTAKYANGTSRDVTPYLVYSEEPLTLDDREFTLRFELGGHQKMYQNKNGEVGAEYFVPTTTLDLIVSEEHIHRHERVVTEPTCTGPGFTTHICACGDSYVDSETPALGHDWMNGVCKRCGEGSPFTDVSADSFCFTPVLWAVEKGITNGTSPATFGPGEPCLRAQVVTFLWRAAGSPEPETAENPFVDVPETAFYYKAVLWAVEKGVTNGVDATHFGPMTHCNRAQVVTFLHRAMETPAPGNQECPFTDVASGSWYEQAVLWAVENGITNGLSATAFGPTTVCNRAQIVTFLYRAFAA